MTARWSSGLERVSSDSPKVLGSNLWRDQQCVLTCVSGFSLVPHTFLNHRDMRAVFYWLILNHSWVWMMLVCLWRVCRQLLCLKTDRWPIWIQWCPPIIPPQPVTLRRWVVYHDGDWLRKWRQKYKETHQWTRIQDVSYRWIHTEAHLFLWMWSVFLHFVWAQTHSLSPVQMSAALNSQSFGGWCRSCLLFQRPEVLQQEQRFLSPALFCQWKLQVLEKTWRRSTLDQMWTLSSWWLISSCPLFQDEAASSFRRTGSSAGAAPVNRFWRRTSNRTLQQNHTDVTEFLLTLDQNNFGNNIIIFIHPFSAWFCVFHRNVKNKFSLSGLRFRFLLWLKTNKWEWINMKVNCNMKLCKINRTDSWVRKVYWVDDVRN